MKNKTKLTLERFATNQYRMILEGICVGFLTGLVVSVFRLGLEKAESLRGSVLVAAKTGGQMLALAFAALFCAYAVV